MRGGIPLVDECAATDEKSERRVVRSRAEGEGSRAMRCVAIDVGG